jgi:RNA polymerase sigma-70 factor, ECF subfamily
VHDDWRTTSRILDLMTVGDGEAWQQFVARFREPLRRLASRLGLDHGEAEDATQQVLLLFRDGLAQGRYDRERGRLSSWLFGIAHHEIRRRRQRAQRRDAVENAVGEVASEALADPQAERDWDRTWREQVLAAAVARVQREVQPATWQAFARVHLGEEDPATVAADLGITRNAVFVAKHRVLARLRALEREFDDVAPGKERE